MSGQLSFTFDFRHIGVQKKNESEMLSEMGIDTLDNLIDQTVPADIRQGLPVSESVPITEAEYLKHIAEVAKKNTVKKSLLGHGYFDTFTPPVIQRNILENPGWYTQYTPYQAEISQGRLEMLFNFQTMICELSNMDIANASLLDEATAAAEAMTLLHRVREKSKKNADTFFVSNTVYKQTLELIYSRALPLGIKVVVGDVHDIEYPEDLFGILVQYPDMNGAVESYNDVVKTAHAKDVKVAVASDLMALTLLTPPGDWGADVVVGNSQRFGVPMGFGGPHAAFFACKEAYKRAVPGRIIGLSQDVHGNPAYRMALQTREQHIRRDKATSNICTAQALLANMAASYAIYHGPEGLKLIAQHIHDLTISLAHILQDFGFETNATFFDTLIVDVTSSEKEKLIQLGAEAGYRFWVHDTDKIGISFGQTFDNKDLEAIMDIFKSVARSKKSMLAVIGIPAQSKRKSDFMTQEVFHAYRSETQMMRYLKQLENKDLSLNTSMIPLGSCTMKLNAAVEMMPITWPEFAALHPFVAKEDTLGYQEVVEYLEKELSIVTGFAATSLQPNSGAQGELAGLLAIKAYLESKGEGHRNISLIPTSAHGTNPASAVMAGMTVILVKCRENGDIDTEDLYQKIEKHKDDLACLMITYPSTHGVFEEPIRDICRAIHTAGGQVYMDGANMNAQVGLTSPGAIGADVCHLNLHKTFCIPHGGGGPGVGPICVAAHLAGFLPSHCFSEVNPASTAIRAVAAAPLGSANILLISYAYLKLMGYEGITRASKIAILNANYIKHRLKEDYDVLYVGANGHVAHELIIDCRAFKKSAGIEVDDIAKRMIDYGFHAPTMSFPVPGTLMIEPTESEDKGELDRFCDAMIAIKNEIRDIETGNSDKENNMLKNAPHTADQVTADEWPHPYSRQIAVYPLPYVKQAKFWPSVGRVDNAFGDRNLVCSCPSVLEYA